MIIEHLYKALLWFCDDHAKVSMMIHSSAKAATKIRDRRSTQGTEVKLCLCFLATQSAFFLIEIKNERKTSKILRHFKTLIGDVIGTFRNTTPIVNQKFVRKSQKNESTYHRVSYSKSWYVNYVLLCYAILPPNILKIRTINHAKKSNYLATFKTLASQTGLFSMLLFIILDQYLKISLS